MKRLSLVLVLCFSSLFMGLHAGAASWSAQSSLPEARSRLTATLVAGKIFVIGGAINDTTCTARVDIFKLATGAWGQGTNAPTTFCGHAAVVVAGKIYVLGGSAPHNPGGGGDKVFVLDPKGGTWTERASMPRQRTFHAAAVSDGKIFVFGGQNTGPALAPVDTYDPVTDTWQSQVTNMPIPTYRSSGVTLCDGRILIVGSNSGMKAQIYSPKTNKWQTPQQPLEDRSGTALAKGSDQRIYALGGNGPRFETDTVQIYDPQSDSWSLGQPMSTARIDAAAVGGRRIFAIGGDLKFGNMHDSIEALGMLPLKLCHVQFESDRPRTVRPELRCNWTPWLNRDRPSGSGDYETLADFHKAGQACARPTKVECRSTDGTMWQQTGQTYRCDAAGGVCLNAEQSAGQPCRDYEVRFCCPLTAPSGWR